jgi:hypothetical protein
LDKEKRLLGRAQRKNCAFSDALSSRLWRFFGADVRKPSAPIFYLGGFESSFLMFDLVGIEISCACGQQTLSERTGREASKVQGSSLAARGQCRAESHDLLSLGGVGRKIVADRGIRPSGHFK